MSLDVEIVWNQANFDHFFHSWSGPVGRYIAPRAERLAALGRGSAGVRTGALKAAIGVSYGHRGKALEAKVGANPTLGKRGYGYWHHEGTSPHKISARHASALRYSMAGKTVYRASVHHPGTRANRYLTDHMKEVLD